MKLNRVLESLRTEKDGTEHCYLYLRLLQEMARLLLRIGAVSTQDVLFMEDCFETLSKRRSITLNEQDRAQVKRVHELVNEALYEVSYQISVSDRRALIAEFFSPTRARTLLDSEGQELGEELGLLDPRKPKTLKAPGSEGADTDYVRKVIADYREQGKVQQVSSPALTEAIRLIPDQQPVLANLVVHCVDAGDQLGLPQFTGAVNPQEMFYALGEKEPGDACLNIYCTKAFWKILQKNALMLAFFLDHEWQEKWLGKTHAAASLRAWLFTDELGMNPFYRFFIDQLGQNRQISYLKSLTRSHVSDPKNVFKSYAMITEAKTVLSVPEAVHSLSEQDAVL